MLWQFCLSLAYLLERGPVSEEALAPPSLRIPLQIKYHGPQSSEDMGEAYRALYSENDMILPKGFSNGGMGDTRYRWPGYPGAALVPYEIDESLYEQRGLIERAMNQFHQHTCVRFVPRTSESDYVRIRRGNSCKSVVGRNSGEQELILDDGCMYIGTIVHELGHTIGMLHEHQRSDRDSYLTIYNENIEEGQEDSFSKIPSELEASLSSFNHNSIMMYGNYAYSKQPGDLKTMESKNGAELIDPFQKSGLHHKDIEQINRLYQCRRQ